MKRFLQIVVFTFFLITTFGIANNANASSVDLRGYAWNADKGVDGRTGGAGWINFNNTSTGSNTSSGVDYKVIYDQSSKKLTGYAWSEHYGYIQFGGNLSTGSSDSFPNSCSTNCDASITGDDTNGYKMTGYARLCFVYEGGCPASGTGTLRPQNERGGYDGWIALSDTNVDISYNKSKNAFVGKAWGGGSYSTKSGSYAEGIGWIGMEGLSCAVTLPANCIDDGVGAPVVTVTTSPANPVTYNSSLTTKMVTVSWTITNVPNGCTPTTTSTPTNSTWNTSIGTIAGDGTTTKVYSGGRDIFALSKNTTFKLSCTYSGKTGDASQIVEVYNPGDPQVTLKSTPSNVTYNNTTPVSIDFTVTKNPYGCTGKLERTMGGTTIVAQNNIAVPGDGTDATVYSSSTAGTSYTGTKAKNLTADATWKFTCTANTPPSMPAGEGSAEATTTVTVPDPTITLTAEDAVTHDTSVLSCDNGAKISYSYSTVQSGSCKAYINGVNTDTVWGSTTSLTGTTKTGSVTTNKGTQTGIINYSLQCNKVDGTAYTPVTAKLNRTCRAGAVSITSSNTCYQTGSAVQLTYMGSGVVSGTCTKSTNAFDPGWSGTINNTGFSSGYTIVGGTLANGTYTYSIGNCSEQSYPNKTPKISASVTFDVKTTCTTTNSGGGSSNRTGTGPIFKEQ